VRSERNELGIKVVFSLQIHACDLSGVKPCQGPNNTFHIINGGNNMKSIVSVSLFFAIVMTMVFSTFPVSINASMDLEHHEMMELIGAKRKYTDAQKAALRACGVAAGLGVAAILAGATGIGIGAGAGAAIAGVAALGDCIAGL
jgi:hypothetical protein